MGNVWQDLLQPGRVALLHAPGRRLLGFFQELTHHAIHSNPGTVLWCDGDHGFNPYDFAELNLTNGFSADDGADRILVKRCMTPFQWDTVLTRHLDEKLQDTETSLVVVNPFDRLWSHEEIQDWEQEDYTRFSLKHLAKTARRFKVPVLLGVDMDRWWRTHPTLAKATMEGVDDRWHIEAPDGRWKATRDDGFVLDPHLRRQVTLLDFVEESEQEALATVPTRRSTKETLRPPFRTRIVHPVG